MAKDAIVEALGERQLLLPTLIAEALAANDRVKYLLTLLQSARSAADGAPDIGNLHEERLASGVEDGALDRVVAESAAERDGRYRIPGAAKLVRQAIAEVQTMLTPLEAAELAAAQALQARTDTIAAALAVAGELVRAQDVELLTAPRRQGQDSLHLVVMDAHRELNALQARIATESVDGAHAYDLAAGDRELIRAFMRGLHRTERLRFDHPGLGTVATHAGRALLIQNELGETDAHVVVVRVIERVLTITYTDVHLQRLLFFQEQLSRWRMSWEDTRSHTDATIEEGLYHLASGRFEARDQPELERFLEHLGSRLVFIIDWNRARKRLRRLVGRKGALELLRFAAEQEYGHIAFLRAGGDGLIYDALQFAGGRMAHAGESLEDVLGARAALSYMRAVLRICSEGLQAGEALSLIQDEVRAELTGYLRSARQEILALVLRHAELIVEIAEGARDGVEQAILDGGEHREATASRAQRGEHEADAVLGEARAAATRAPDLQPLLELLEAADDIADCAEEAAFYAKLLPPGHPTGAVREHVRRIAALVLTASREYLRAVELSSELRRGSPRADMDAFLEAAYKAIALEHDTDDAQRAVHTALAAGGEPDGSAQFVVVELTRSFEEASDALMHSAHLLRGRALAQVVGSESVLELAAEPPPQGPPPPVGEHVYLLEAAAAVIPDASVIGNKAHGLARIARAGLRVPEAAVLSTSLARARREGALDMQELQDVLAGAVATLEARTGLRLGSSRAPLLLSVRSGAPVSMPGMLDTVLDVGMSEASARGLIALSGNPRLAWDSYRRFVESYATVVHGCPREPFEQALRAQLQEAGARSPRELSASELAALTRAHLERFKQMTGKELPEDPMEQLQAAVLGVLASWDAPRAQEYRRLHDIPDELGTAVILQRMVFGNAGGVSGAGVGFTRDPALGARHLYMDFLLDAQGEDVVGGRQTVEGSSELAAVAPDVLGEIERVCPRLEAEFGDAQEFELTVQEGELFLLQTRAAKRTPWAALRIAVDQVHEGLASERAALARLRGLDLDALKRVHVDASQAGEPLGHAIPASVGVACGPVALDREAAERIAQAGTPPVLVRADALTEDLAVLTTAAGLLTGAGSRTSHAAVVARELDRPCLVGCSELCLDLDARTARIRDRVLAEGDVICLDAESGVIFAGSPPVVEERPTRELEVVAGWRAAHVGSEADELAEAGR